MMPSMQASLSLRKSAGQSRRGRPRHHTAGEVLPVRATTGTGVTPSSDASSSTRRVMDESAGAAIRTRRARRTWRRTSTAPRHRLPAIQTNANSVQAEIESMTAGEATGGDESGAGTISVT